MIIDKFIELKNLKKLQKEITDNSSTVLRRHDKAKLTFFELHISGGCKIYIYLYS